MTQLSTFHDMDTLFEHIYNKLITPNFGENLGGELPLYIQPFPTRQQSAIPQQVERLMKRLEKKGISSLNINLYDLCTQILQEEGILDAILEGEREIDKDTMVSTLDSVLDIKTVIIPRIQSLIAEKEPKFVFIHAIGRVYPFLRSHGILNNIDELTAGSNLIFFFPGEYNNLQLKLFGRISDENYYRGQNLSDIIS